MSGEWFYPLSPSETGGVPEGGGGGLGQSERISEVVKRQTLNFQRFFTLQRYDILLAECEL